jgi:hypothetical protein
MQEKNYFIFWDTTSLFGILLMFFNVCLPDKVFRLCIHCMSVC